MRSSSIAIVGLAAAALGAAAWLALRARETTGISSDDAIDAGADAAGSAGASRAGAGLAAGGRESVGRPKASGSGVIVGVVARDGKPAAAHVEYRRAWPASFFAKAEWADRLAARFAPEGPADAIGDASDDGKFRLEPASGFGTVIATSADGRRGVVRLRNLGSGASPPIVVQLRPIAARIRGRARYADGREFSGFVVIDAGAYWSRPRASDAAKTDGEGRFDVEASSEAGAYARFVVPGVIEYALSAPKAPPVDEWDVVVDEHASMIDGVVLDDATGDPVLGAEIVSHADSYDHSISRMITARVASDASGRFTVPRSERVFAGVTLIVPAARGYAAVRTEARGPDSGVITIRLRRAASISGTIVRASDGAPVAGAHVLVVPVGSGVLGDPVADVVADARGRYEAAGLSPMDVGVFASAPGLAMLLPSDPRRTRWPEITTNLRPGESAVMDVRLVAAGAIEGHVVDADGKAVAGANVSIVSLEQENSPTEVDPFAWPRSSTTGTDGAFRLDGLAPGLRTTLWAEFRGVRIDSAPTLPGVGEPARVEIRFPRGGTLDVTVLDENSGRAIDGVLLTSHRGPQATTDANGHATLAYAPMETGIHLYAHKRGYGEVYRHVTSTETAIEWRLKPALPLRGVVVGEDGKPLAHARLLAGGSTGVSDETDEDGTFSIEDTPDRELPVEVDLSLADGTTFYARTKARPSASDRLRIVATKRPPPAAMPTRRLVVRARDADGVAIPTAKAKVEGASGTLSAGAWVFERAPKKPLTVEVWDARDEHGNSLGLAPGRAELTADAEEIVVVLGRGAAIEGTVVGPDGQTMRGVVVEAVRPERATLLARPISPYAPPDPALWIARSGPDGRFRIDGLPSGEDLRVGVATPPGVCTFLPIAARAGATDITLRLRRGVGPVVRIVDIDDRPIAYAEVVVETLRASHSVLSELRETSYDGTVRLAALDPDRPVRLEVRTWRASSREVASTVVDRWTPHDDTLRLARLEEVRGVVTDEDGKPIAHASVARIGAERHEQDTTATTDGEGRFRLRCPIREHAELRVQGDHFVTRRVDLDRVSATVPLAIALSRGAEGWVRVEGWPADGEGTVFLWDDERPDQTLAEFWTRAPRAGRGEMTIRFGSVEPGRTYTLFIAGKTDVYALARGLRFGTEEAPTFVVASRGGAIRGRLTRAFEAGWPTVTARCGGLRLKASVSPNGDFEFRGVPPGRFVLTARMESGSTGDSVEWESSTDASAGEVVSLEFLD